VRANADNEIEQRIGELLFHALLQYTVTRRSPPILCLAVAATVALDNELPDQPLMTALFWTRCAAASVASSTRALGLS
jgi:hypothetical protein